MMVVALVALTLVHGTVRIGPTSPVCRVETPCTKPAANVTLSFVHGATRVSARTDMLGHYQVRLTPGTWTLTARLGIRPGAVRFVVPRAASARRDFAFDTGIR